MNPPDPNPTNQPGVPAPPPPVAASPPVTSPQPIQNPGTPQKVSDSETYQTFFPTKNKPALLGYYFGIIGLLPLLGLPFTVLAIVYGLKGLKQYKTTPTPGAKAHALVGIWLAGFEVVVFIIFLIIAILAFVTTPNK